MYELGITQEDVAKKLSMDVSTFNSKLNNNRRFYLDEVAGLSEVLGITSKSELAEYFGLEFLILKNSRKNETEN